MNFSGVADRRDATSAATLHEVNRIIFKLRARWQRNIFVRVHSTKIVIRSNVRSISLFQSNLVIPPIYVSYISSRLI